MNRQDLADQPEGRQNHDVDSWVGIKPEQMLVDNDVAAAGWIEETGVGDDVHAQQDQRACQDWRG